MKIHFSRNGGVRASCGLMLRKREVRRDRVIGHVWVEKEFVYTDPMLLGAKLSDRCERCVKAFEQVERRRRLDQLFRATGVVRKAVSP